MSVRHLYQAIPESQRICSFYRCQQPILRNITKTEDGRIWHYGCLMTARDQKFYCFNCQAQLDGTQVTPIDINGQQNFACLLCGSMNIKTPEDYRREWLQQRIEAS